jgi:hypothetical protein
MASPRASSRRALWLRLLTALALGLGAVPQAHALYLALRYNTAVPIDLSLTVGQAGTTTSSEVVFDVNTATLLTPPIPVTGIVTPATTARNDVVRLSVVARPSAIPRTVTISVTSGPLVCTTGCSGSGISIPANKISWTDISVQNQAQYGGGALYNSIGNGTFTGGTQTLRFFVWGSTPGPGYLFEGIELRADFVFQYLNDTTYPPGSYTSTFVYSAVMP